MSKGLEKYLQDAEQCRALEVNYFDDNTTCQSEEPNPEEAEQMIQPFKGTQIPPIQMPYTDTKVARNALESLKETPVMLHDKNVQLYMNSRNKL